MSDPILLNKKDIRILFNVDKDRKISEVEVAEFTKDHNPQYLYKRFTSDIGNASTNWDKWNLHAVTIDFFINHGFVSKEVEDTFIKEMLKIKEFQQDVKPYFDHMNLYC